MLSFSIGAALQEIQQSDLKINLLKQMLGRSLLQRAPLRNSCLAKR